MNKKLIKKIWNDGIFQNVFSGFLIMILGLLFISNDQVKSEVHQFITPDIIRYSGEIQLKAANEIESGKCPALTEFAKDFLVMRDQTRIIKGEDIPQP